MPHPALSLSQSQTCFTARRREAEYHTIDPDRRGGSADVLDACRHSETDCLRDGAIQWRCKQERRNQKPMKGKKDTGSVKLRMAGIEASILHGVLLDFIQAKPSPVRLLGRLPLRGCLDQAGEGPERPQYGLGGRLDASPRHATRAFLSENFCCTEGPRD